MALRVDQISLWHMTLNWKGRHLNLEPSALGQLNKLGHGNSLRWKVSFSFMKMIIPSLIF